VSVTGFPGAPGKDPLRGEARLGTGEGAQHFWHNIRIVGARLSGVLRQDEMPLWTSAPNTALGGATPADMILNGRMDDVLKAIEEMEEKFRDAV